MTGHPEHHFLKYYQPKGDDVYVEVGAALGETAVLLPASVRKILVEAEPKSADYLERMIAIGQLQNTVVVRTAIASSKGRQTFRAMGAHLNCSRLTESLTHQFALWQNEKRGKQPDWTPQGEPVSWEAYDIEVECDTLEAVLDSLGIDHVDLLASDCESCEFDMVAYAGKWLNPAKVRNWAIAAYHIHTRAYWLMQQVSDAGYRLQVDFGGEEYHHPQLVVYGLGTLN